MERFLFLLAVLMIVGCFSMGFLSLRQFAHAEDLRGLLYAGLCIFSGVSAGRLLSGSGGDE